MSEQEQLTPEEIKNGWYYPGFIESVWDYVRGYLYRRIAMIRCRFIVMPIVFNHALVWGDRYGGELDRRIMVRVNEVARKKKSAQLRWLSAQITREYLGDSEE